MCCSISAVRDFVIISCLFAYVVIIVMGILLLKLDIKQNRWFGVRVPWTMCDKDIWRRAQIFAGKVMVIGCLLGLIMIYFFRHSAYYAIFIIFFVNILIIGFIQIGYSMIAYKKKYGTLKIKKIKKHEEI